VGDVLIGINGAPVLDIIDYEYLSANRSLVLQLKNANGEPREVAIKKPVHEPLGLLFDSGLMSEVRACKNHCIFCFIDQMPKGGRDTLRFKDDDWRMSFIMGNYVSLTNIDEVEFQRIIDRRVSPLYISVHATDPAVRSQMMRNPAASTLMGRLRALKDAKLAFHCQIVCCPGINDGSVLEKTLNDLFGLYPYAQSVAIVPVGLTKYRQGLSLLRVFTPAEAKAALRQIQVFAKMCKHREGVNFAYASDEFYILAGDPLPGYDEYDGFSQIENGVGLLRLFEYDFLERLRDMQPRKAPLYVHIAGGVSASPFFQELYKALVPYHIFCDIRPIRNDYFGETVTVGGLVTGQDLIAQLRGKLTHAYLLLPHNMLREGEDVFLDGYTLRRVAEALRVEIVVVRGEGEDWVNTLFSLNNGGE
jgi:putative radical SAM enzyme (TIGR03279 family)